MSSSCPMLVELLQWQLQLLIHEPCPIAAYYELIQSCCLEKPVHWKPLFWSLVLLLLPVYVCRCLITSPRVFRGQSQQQVSPIGGAEGIHTTIKQTNVLKRFNIHIYYIYLKEKKNLITTYDVTFSPHSLLNCMNKSFYYYKTQLDNHLHV